VPHPVQTDQMQVSGRAVRLIRHHLVRRLHPARQLITRYVELHIGKILGRQETGHSRLRS
ncbi:MAG: hypothetical protein ACU84Q_13985, partial [Gammaproteobacteria bacterium]